MKKTFIIYVLVIAAITFTGCTKQPENKTIEGIVKTVEYKRIEENSKFSDVIVSFDDGRTISLCTYNYMEAIIIKTGKNNKITYGYLPNGLFPEHRENVILKVTF